MSYVLMVARHCAVGAPHAVDALGDVSVDDFVSAIERPRLSELVSALHEPRLGCCGLALEHLRPRMDYLLSRLMRISAVSRLSGV